MKVSVKCFLFLGAEKFGRGTTLLCCVPEISGNEKVFEKRVTEYQKFQSKVFCLTVPKKLLVEQPFCAAFQKISGGEKVLKKRGKEYQRFQSKTFCLTVPKNLVGEAFCAVFQKFSGSEKVLEKKREYQEFSWRVFWSRSAEIFGRRTSVLCCISENFW